MSEQKKVGHDSVGLYPFSLKVTDTLQRELAEAIVVVRQQVEAQRDRSADPAPSIAPRTGRSGDDGV